MNDESGRYRLSQERQNKIGITHKELKEKVHDRHEVISDQFNSGIGLHTQYVDSQIAEQVMREMMEDGVLVLPIHDSFIVRAGFEQHISVVMEDCFNELTKGQVGVKADGPRLQKHFGMSKEESSEELRKLEEDPSIAVVNLAEYGLDEMLIADESMMGKYVGSWEAWRRQ